MSKQPFFYLEVSNGLWGVVGPVTVTGYPSTDMVSVSTGLIILIKDIYRTKGGASKECHKRNYLLKAIGVESKQVSFLQKRKEG